MGFYERQSQADWEEGYAAGHEAGYQLGVKLRGTSLSDPAYAMKKGDVGSSRKRKQKPSAWNKFVKANSKKKKFIYQSGANKGKLNLKKMGVAWRKTPAGKKKQ